jgi:hypothetical protein
MWVNFLKQAPSCHLLCQQGLGLEWLAYGQADGSAAAASDAARRVLCFVGCAVRRRGHAPGRSPTSFADLHVLYSLLSLTLQVSCLETPHNAVLTSA